MMSMERKRIIKGFIVGHLFEAGLITLEQLDSALERQLELIVKGDNLSLGEVLVEMGIITREELDRVRSREWTNDVEFHTVPTRAESQGGGQE
jgi:hypothetical protein